MLGKNRVERKYSNSKNQRGQILIEALSLIAFFIAFLALSAKLFEDYRKTSYRYLLTQSLQEKNLD